MSEGKGKAGSDFDEFLEEEGIKDEVYLLAANKILKEENQKLKEIINSAKKILVNLPAIRIEKKEIKICRSHSDYQVPLIYTFAFNGAEYWCPYCGINEGMMGAGTNVVGTEKLMGREAIYKDHSESFIDARSALICSGMKLENRELKKENEDIPPILKDKFRELAKSWVYNIKATRLMQKDVLDKLEPKCVECSYFMSCNKNLNSYSDNTNGPCQEYTEEKITVDQKEKWNIKNPRTQEKQLQDNK